MKSAMHLFDITEKHLFDITEFYDVDSKILYKMNGELIKRMCTLVRLLITYGYGGDIGLFDDLCEMAKEEVAVNFKVKLREENK